jgi:hypothetical protein
MLTCLDRECMCKTKRPHFFAAKTATGTVKRRIVEYVAKVRPTLDLVRDDLPHHTIIYKPLDQLKM